ncbi:MAG: hypothetical protein HYT07_03430 [Candidatus Levybacteria bacterium]|nr:hypothetical protein [Candidatus Levybacteria bacterium]
MKKQKKPKIKSPSIYRLITETFRENASKFERRKVFNIYRKSLKYFTVFIFLMAIIFLGFDLRKNIQEKQRLDSEREKILKELNFWKYFISKYDNYRDAYFQTSILEYKLGNKEIAKLYLEKGLKLDPNSEKGKSIKELLDKK